MALTSGERKRRIKLKRRQLAEAQKAEELKLAEAKERYDVLVEDVINQTFRGITTRPFSKKVINQKPLPGSFESGKR